MKNPTKLIKISLVLCLFALATTIGEYLALHDIWHDYVSKEVIESYQSSSFLKLPEWSNTKLEWRMVSINGIFSTIYFIFSALALIVCLRASGKNQSR